jgi:hypothetical protein
MAAPGVSVTVRDGGLGIVPPGAGNLFAKIGPSPIGVVNSVNSVSDNTSLQKACGNGGLMVEAAALALAAGGQGPARPGGLLLVPVNPSTYGTATAVTQSGGGPSVSVAIKPPNAFQLKCILGGAAATATFQMSLDGGITYGATFTSAATLITPGAPFTTLAYGAGSAVAGDIFTVATSGTVTQTSGSGTLAITLSTACPVDAYTVVVTVTAGGVLGAGFFTYSLDGGATVSQPFLIPASGSFIVPDGNDPFKAGQCSTGIVLTFAAGTYVANTTYSFSSTTASYTTTDLTNAFNQLYIDTRFSSGIGLHVVGPASSVANAATLLASLDTLMGTAAGSFKFDRAMIEVPSDTDANTLAAFNASSSNRVGAAAGFHTYTSPLNGRLQSRPAAYSVMARAGSVPAQNDLGRVLDGSLVGVTKLARDEFQTPGLDAGRFSTLTSVPGRNGFWVTNGRLFSQAGSDFTYWQYGRVMDLASYYTRLALLNFLNDSVRVNGDGTISEKDARNIENYTDGFVRNAMPPGSFSDYVIAISRTNNVLSSQTVLPTARVIPLAYAKFVSLDIGFTNQGLVVKAA